MLYHLGHDTAKIEEVVNTCEAVKKHAGEDKGEIEKSKIGVLLFILHSTLAKTGNLALPPPMEGEWTDRLANGLPKVKKSAVLITCRKEDDARTMVRTARVFLPPPLTVDEGWTLFKREYDEAKLKRAAQSIQEKGEDETEKRSADSKQEKKGEDRHEESVAPAFSPGAPAPRRVRRSWPCAASRHHDTPRPTPYAAHAIHALVSSRPYRPRQPHRTPCPRR
ncbi:hypothetical protein GUJ93_ZPchr0008g12528 [Zizania palustris]|uniref:NB-ARC domain-containing protein n=1 Tax=Zizania palustris TaxID=103762 RepID=A0A8J5QWS3_ZIZPA|nr:hypothetical protein GUJ93_ZPchr0008g12528 [Zizania palustris]